MREAQRERFDALLESVLDELPECVRALLDEVPVVVEDRPSAAILRELGMSEDEADELCGLHTGVAFTERSVELPEVPSEIQLYREGIVAEAGGWEPRTAEDGRIESAHGVDESVREEIRVTLLHEIGHQFGLDEDDLARLGYD
jgi:predicted Zn-dependent protease with MMP-like domain